MKPDDSKGIWQICDKCCEDNMDLRLAREGGKAQQGVSFELAWYTDRISRKEMEKSLVMLKKSLS